VNIGERNELIIKLYLIYLRDNKGEFKSIGFGGIEYGKLPKIDDPYILKKLKDEEVNSYANLAGISKSPSMAKSDVEIDEAGYSLKFLGARPPALVNHTTRPGFENACLHAGTNISDIDQLVDEYWNLRLSGVIREDIKNNDPNSPFSSAKNTLKPVLNYFLFDGTGSGLSNYPAEYILEFIDPIDPDTWIFLNKSNAVDYVWDKLRFSIRGGRGMPQNYPNNVYQTYNESIDKWTEYSHDRYRGALHIREG